MPTLLSPLNHDVTLDDKWSISDGTVMLSGTQAIAKVLLAQKSLDEKAGLNTAGYISGYRGSPLGNVDNMLWSIQERLDTARIKFDPGVNEDMAATAVRGTQQIDALPDPLYDGVFGAWYGKGPGVDRAGDALKHGNFIGTHPHGGVVAFYGDDHGGKSSSLSHHSEQAMAAALIPSFYPADPGEVLHFGLMAYALSRYCGLWVGIKLVNEIAEQTATVDIALSRFAPVLPPKGDLPPDGIHVRGGALTPMRDEIIVSEHRLPLVETFLRANPVDRTAFRASVPKLGLVTAGKSYKDTLQALALLGLDEGRAAEIGISLYKVGCIWPLESRGLENFAADQEILFFIEEKKSFVELQAAAVLANVTKRPLFVGKRDEQGERLLPLAAQLDPLIIAKAIAGRLRAADMLDGWNEPEDMSVPPAPLSAALPKRSPYFCSGCPHSRSTKVPDGSLAMAGIGCHVMTNFLKPEKTLSPTHMGGEGGNWMGLAPFSGTRHIFQNMGDGTYYHSGLMAIRAAIASGVNITYKILYNDAVAMTGGQPVDGPISVSEIAHQVLHEGAKQLVLVSDDPKKHRSDRSLPQGLRIVHRDQLDDVQRELRDVSGCTVIVYEQTCAAEKRRRRKRGTFPDPAKRLFISQDVCEGCGDCSVQSTCVSLVPVETEMGTKRAIDQSSCNKDYSCLNGFCPSFLTVYDAEPRKPAKIAIDESLFAAVPEPAVRALSADGFSMLVTGIGGTGVITVAAVLGMAAHIEGKSASIFDMTGLAQKNGAVLSHVKIAPRNAPIHASKVGKGEADLLLAFDVVAALADDARDVVANGRTRAVVNANIAPTVEFQFDRDAKVDSRLLVDRLSSLTGKANLEPIDATALATGLMGDSIATNFFLVGIAIQRGLLPLEVAAVERAIELNGTAVRFNLESFRLGRLYAVDPEKIRSLGLEKPATLPVGTAELIESMAKRIEAYQDLRLADRYRKLVAKVQSADRQFGVTDGLTRIAAQQYARLMTYKDEYEVARLLSSPKLRESLAQSFQPGGRIEVNLAPPMLPGRDPSGRPRKRAFNASWMLPLLGVLARFRLLRGSALDPFGYTEERKQERALIVAYEEMVAQILPALTPTNYDEAVGLLGRVASVRGFGPVKRSALDEYNQSISKELRLFLEQSGLRAAA